MAQQAVDAVLTLCRRGNRLGAGVLFAVVIVCVGGFLLGLLAFDGAAEVMWILVGGFFAVLAIGMIVMAMVHLFRITKTASALVDEVQALLDGDVVTERTIIETVEAADAVEGESAMVLSRQFSTLQTEVVRSGRSFPNVTEAMSGIARFPLYLLLSSMISLVFAVLSLLFLISLAF